jgi:hypothetical protein
MFQFDLSTFCHRSIDKLTQGALELVGGNSQVTVALFISIFLTFLVHEKSELGTNTYQSRK